jgi:hypothetical protein
MDVRYGDDLHTDWAVLCPSTYLTALGSNTTNPENVSYVVFGPEPVPVSALRSGLSCGRASLSVWNGGGRWPISAVDRTTSRGASHGDLGGYSWTRRGQVYRPEMPWEIQIRRRGKRGRDPFIDRCLSISFLVCTRRSNQTRVSRAARREMVY